MIREYHPADLSRLLAIYEAQGFTYPFPELESPRFLTKLVHVDRGRVTQAICARLTCEAYLMMDPDAGDPEQRWANFQELQEEAAFDLYEKGLEDVHCWVPPERLKAFGRRLVRDLNWVRDDKYTPFVKYLVPRREPQVEEISDGPR